MIVADFRYYFFSFLNYTPSCYKVIKGNDIKQLFTIILYLFFIAAFVFWEIHVFTYVRIGLCGRMRSLTRTYV